MEIPPLRAKLKDIFLMEKPARGKILVGNCCCFCFVVGVLLFFVLFCFSRRKEEEKQEDIDNFTF